MIRKANKIFYLVRPNWNTVPVLNFGIFVFVLSWHRYVFREGSPCPIVISKAFHHAVRNGMLCFNLDEDTKTFMVPHSSCYVVEYVNQNQIPRSIRTCQLQNALLHFYIMPIKRLVLPWPCLSLSPARESDKRALILRWTSYLYAFSSYLLQT